MVQVIAERAERATLIVTTNLPFSEWTQVFPNPRLSKALLDRITDRAHIIETEWMGALRVIEIFSQLANRIPAQAISKHSAPPHANDAHCIQRRKRDVGSWRAVVSVPPNG